MYAYQFWINLVAHMPAEKFAINLLPLIFRFSDFYINFQLPFQFIVIAAILCYTLHGLYLYLRTSAESKLD